MELFQPFLGRFLPLFQVSAAAKILFFSETSLLKQEYFLKISPIKTIFPLWGELLLMCIKLFIHPHLESFTAQCLQVGGEASLAKYRRKLYITLLRLSSLQCAPLQTIRLCITFSIRYLSAYTKAFSSRWSWIPMACGLLA